MNIIIIGTSSIVEHHINCFLKINFKILAICTLNKNSSKHIYLQNKYKIRYSFNNLSQLLNLLKKHKNYCFFLAPRIKDTKFVLEKCLPYKKKIFVEKPVSTSLIFLKKLQKYKKYIFVGYNRIFYTSIVELKKTLNYSNNLFIEASCSEKNKQDILTNSCHIISIIINIFGNIKITKIIRNKNYIFAYASDKKKNLFLFKFNFNSSENFYLKIIDKRKVYKLKPLENFTLYNGLKLETNKGLNYYIPVIKKNKNEILNSKFKPGFLRQAKLFKKFLNKKIKIENDIIFAYKVMKVCKKIYG